MASLFSIALRNACCALRQKNAPEELPGEKCHQGIYMVAANKKSPSLLLDLVYERRREKALRYRQQKAVCEKPGSKTKSGIIDDLMQYVGCKSRKHAVRGLNRTPRKRKSKPSRTP